MGAVSACIPSSQRQEAIQALRAPIELHKKQKANLAKKPKNTKKKGGRKESAAAADYEVWESVREMANALRTLARLLELDGKPAEAAGLITQARSIAPPLPTDADSDAKWWADLQARAAAAKKAQAGSMGSMGSMDSMDSMGSMGSSFD